VTKIRLTDDDDNKNSNIFVAYTKSNNKIKQMTKTMLQNFDLHSTEILHHQQQQPL